MILTLVRIMQISVSKVFVFFLFFVKVYNYCVEWLPLDDAFIKHSVLVDFERRNEVTFDYIETSLQIFNRIHKAIVQDPSILDAVEEEFLDYQIQIIFGNQLNYLIMVIEWMLYGAN